jgi:hypothetical protein
MKTIINFVLEDYTCFSRENQTRAMLKASKSSQDRRRNRQLDLSSSYQEQNELKLPNSTDIDCEVDQNVYIEMPADAFVQLEGNSNPSRCCGCSVGSGVTNNTHESDYTIGLQSTKHSAVASITDVYNRMSLLRNHHSSDSSVESSFGGSFDGVENGWDSDLDDDKEDSSFEANETNNDIEYVSTITLLQDVEVVRSAWPDSQPLEKYLEGSCPDSGNGDCNAGSLLSKNNGSFAELSCDSRPLAVSSVTGTYRKLFCDYSTSKSSSQSYSRGRNHVTDLDFEDDIEESSVGSGTSVDIEVERIQALILQIKTNQ